MGLPPTKDPELHRQEQLTKAWEARARAYARYCAMQRVGRPSEAVLQEMDRTRECLILLGEDPV